MVWSAPGFTPYNLGTKAVELDDPFEASVCISLGFCFSVQGSGHG